MANNPKRTAAVANAACDACTAFANSGILRIYDGSQPASAAVAVGAQNILAELTLNATAFAGAVAGVATANAITGDSSANTSGTATWFRQFASNGTTVLWDGSVGTSGADLNLNSVALSSGAAVAISAYTFTESLG